MLHSFELQMCIRMHEAHEWKKRQTKDPDNNHQVHLHALRNVDQKNTNTLHGDIA